MELQRSIDAIEEGYKNLSPLNQAAMRPILDEILFKDPTIPAAASLSKHGGFDGGLIVHSCRVWEIARTFGRGLNDLAKGIPLHPPFVSAKLDIAAELNSLSEDSLFKVAIIHDLNKARTLVGSPCYVPNILQGGKRSDKKPWERSEAATQPLTCLAHALREETLSQGMRSILHTVLRDQGVQIREGLVSLAVAFSVSPNLFISMTPEEEFAIIFHDGAYAGRTDLQEHEKALQIILHAADMLASRVFC